MFRSFVVIILKIDILFRPKGTFPTFSALEIEDDETVEEAVPRLISRNRTYALLNAGAFGTAYDAVRELAAALRRYSEDESEIFYDQGCYDVVTNLTRMLRKVRSRTYFCA